MKIYSEVGQTICKAGMNLDLCAAICGPVPYGARYHTINIMSGYLGLICNHKNDNKVFLFWSM
jgi:hypothetical protein